MTRVLVITGGWIGEQMAGPALRAWNIARVLTDDGHTVTLATTGDLDTQQAEFAQIQLAEGDEQAFRRLESTVEVIVFQGLANRQFRSLRRSQKVLVADLYDPMHIEELERTRSLGETHAEREIANATWIVDDQLLIADLVLAASERQRHLYLGHLAALGRITPRRYRADPDLATSIAVVPYGLGDDAPVHERRVLRGVVPGFEQSDKILIWAGGIYEWFDPETLIRAVGLLGDTRPELRLFFIGTRGPGTVEMPIVARSRELAAQLGVLGTSVFFNEGWIPWDDRHNYLLEADAGVSTHRAHLETEFSFRTRVLDYLWAGLPMILTADDIFADLAREQGLGAVVHAQDPAALAVAIESVVYNPDVNASSRANVASIRPAFAWPTVLLPLREFVREPHINPDRLRGRGSTLRRAIRAIRAEPRTAVGRVARRAGQVVRREGIWGIVRRVARR